MNNFSEGQVSDVVRCLQREVPLEITMEEGTDIDVLEITDRGWVYYRYVSGGSVGKVRVNELKRYLLGYNRYLVDYVVYRNMGY